MAASSNFGNMFSVVGASAFLPFLPMRPIQVLTNNLLYDFSQTTIPTDAVDADWLIKPRKWEIGGILRFILFIGPISSIFDYLTFFMMLYVFNCWHNPDLFQTGWFVESLFTQTLIIHVIRTNKIPFFQSWASWPLILSSVIIVAVGRLADGFAPGRFARVCPASAPVLVATGDHLGMLCGPYPVDQDMVLPQIWRMIAVVRSRHSLSRNHHRVFQKGDIMTNTDDRQHRSILQRIAHRAMLERGLVPDFPAQARRTRRNPRASDANRGIDA